MSRRTYTHQRRLSKWWLVIQQNTLSVHWIIGWADFRVLYVDAPLPKHAHKHTDCNAKNGTDVFHNLQLKMQPSGVANAEDAISFTFYHSQHSCLGIAEPIWRAGESEYHAWEATRMGMGWDAVGCCSSFLTFGKGGRPPAFFQNGQDRAPVPAAPPQVCGKSNCLIWQPSTVSYVRVTHFPRTVLSTC